MDWTPALIAEAQAIYDDGSTPHKTAERLRGLHKIRVTAEDVRSVVKLRTHARALEDGLREEIRRIRETERLSYLLISLKLGVPMSTVEWCCRGMPIPEGGVIGALRSRGGLSKKEAAKRGIVRVPAQPKPVEVPAWVPAHLHEFYEAVALRDCEEQAASICRTLKRGGSVAHL